MELGIKELLKNTFVQAGIAFFLLLLLWIILELSGALDLVAMF